MDRDKAYVDRFAKYRCMSDTKWKKFFLALIDKLVLMRRLYGSQGINGGVLWCKSLRDNCIRSAVLSKDEIEDKGIGDPGFGGPQMYYTIEWILITRILAINSITGNKIDCGYTEELYNYLQSVAKFPLELNDEGILVRGYLF